MYLVSLEIKNVRAIQHMVVDFRNLQPGEPTRRWTVLFGENGCGKSTVLKSIGLVLAGSEALPGLIGSADEWIRNGAKRAEIHAVIRTVEGDERKVSLVLERGDGRDSVIKRNSAGLQLLDAAIRHSDRNYFVAGYGAFRRPPESDNRNRYRARQDRAAQLATLYLQSAELMSVEQWAMELDYSSSGGGLKTIADALEKLLPNMKFKKIDKATLSVVMSTVDGDLPLRQLSEGYQAMAAWAGDLLYRMTGAFSDRKNPLDARGVLLIDEMDLHLHPLWKRSLIDFLNQAFPRLQIIATTHSPLSVQQCGEGELYVVRRERLGPTLVPFVGDPSNLRLSELFLSPLIGLDTLDSPRVAALRREARTIELKPGRRSTDDIQRLKGIQKGLVGTTSFVNEEAPQFSKLMQYQTKLQALDPSVRIRVSEGLFGPNVNAKAKPTAVKKAAAKKAVAGKSASKKPASRKAASQKAAVKKTSGTAPAVSKRATSAAKPAAPRRPTAR